MSINHTLSAGVSPADRKRLATLAGYEIPGKGLVLAFTYCYPREQEETVTSNLTVPATKTGRPYHFGGTEGRPVFIHVIQNMDDVDGHRESVSVYDAATEEYLGGNDEGNLAPLLPGSSRMAIDFLNQFVGRTMAVIPKEAVIVKKKPADARKPKSKPELPTVFNIEHDLEVAARLIENARSSRITGKTFRALGKLSRRYDGEWSKGMQREPKILVDNHK